MTVQGGGFYSSELMYSTFTLKKINETRSVQNCAEKAQII